MTDPQRELPPSFEDLRAKLVAAAEDQQRARRERRARRWRYRTLLPAAAAAIVVAGTGAAVGGLFTGSGDPLPSKGRDSPQGVARPADPGVLVDSAAPDPIAGELPWVLRVYSNAAGEDCYELGRLREGRFGHVIDRQFRVQADPAGTCVNVGRQPISVSIRRQPEPKRTVIYGLSRSREPVRVTIGRDSRTVQPGALGAFVAVVEGLPDLAGATAATDDGGRPVVRRLGRTSRLPPPSR